jgi:hypothetical protein
MQKEGENYVSYLFHTLAASVVKVVFGAVEVRYLWFPP